MCSGKQVSCINLCAFNVCLEWQHIGTSAARRLCSVCWLEHEECYSWYWQVTCRWKVHTHTCLMALFLGLPGWAVPEGKTDLDFTEARVSGSGINWAICKSASHSRQYPTTQVFLQAECRSCRPTNSVKALKANERYFQRYCHWVVFCWNSYWAFIQEIIWGVKAESGGTGALCRNMCRLISLVELWLLFIAPVLLCLFLFLFYEN